MRTNTIVTVGTACMDEYYRLPHWIGEGDKVSTEYLFSVPGGTIPNAAAVLAQYGNHTVFLDMMNQSTCTTRLLCDLRRYGVDTSMVLLAEGLMDVKCLIFLSGGERTVMAVDGNKPSFPLDRKHVRLLHAADCLYSTAYELQKIPDIEVHIRSMKQAGGLLALDVEGHTFPTQEHQLMAIADILFFNQYGFENFCNGRAPQRCVLQLQNAGVQYIVVTLGKGGCILYHKQDRFSVPGVSVDVKDPTGAGDTFNSSFLHQLLAGESPRRCLHFANAAAARSVTLVGPKSGAVSQSAVRQFMVERGL